MINVDFDKTQDSDLSLALSDESEVHEKSVVNKENDETDESESQGGRKRKRVGWQYEKTLSSEDAKAEIKKNWSVWKKYNDNKTWYKCSWCTTCPVRMYLQLVTVNQMTMMINGSK